jgi:hypothetical protein
VPTSRLNKQVRILDIGIPLGQKWAGSLDVRSWNLAA